MSSLIEADLSLARLVEEEEELRKISPTDGAAGKNASDYRHMYDMFLSLIEHAKALRADPKAFVDEKGRYNDRIINAYAKLVSLAMKSISELNKMRNQDKMTVLILNTYTKDLVQALAIEMSVELGRMINKIDSGEASSQDVIIGLRRLQHKRLPEILLKSAGETLSTSIEANGLKVH